MNSLPQNTTVALVPGAWADGSCWRDGILPIERHGPTPLTPLTEEVSALTRALERMSGPGVLVGHAY